MKKGAGRGYSGIFWFATDPVVRLFSQKADVVQSATTYLAIVPLSLWGYGVVIITAGAFNAMGRSHYGLGSYVIRTAVFYVPVSFVAARIAGSEPYSTALPLPMRWLASLLPVLRCTGCPITRRPNRLRLEEGTFWPLRRCLYDAIRRRECL